MKNVELRRTLALFCFFLALAVIFTAPVSLKPHELAVNDGDPLHISWGIAWVSHQLVRDPVHLFDSNTFYPYPSSLAFSEHFLGLAFLAAPFFWLSGNALFAQNVAVVLTLALSAFGMYLLTKEILGRRDAAIVAGVVYVFHTYSFHEVPRLQLLSAQWMPLALLFLHRAFTEGGRANAWWFGLFFTLQGLACTYYLFYFGLVLALWIPAYALFVEDGRRRAAALALPLGLSGALFALLSIPYLKMVREFNFERTIAEGLDLLEYLRPPAGGLVAKLVSFDFPPSVVPQFLGFLVLGLALAAVAARPAPDDRPRRLFFALSLTTLVSAVVLSLGPTVRVGGTEWGPGPYGLLYDYVPFFRVLRNAERMSVLVHFGLAVMAGFGAKALFSRLSGRRLSLARVALLVLLPMEHFEGGQPFTPVPTGERVPEVYRWLGGTPAGDPVVELPLYPRRQLRRHALYNFFSTYHWRPIVFGRTSFYPPLVGYLGWELRDFPSSDSIGLLEGLGVERVVVHPKLWPLGQRGERLASLRGFTDRLEPEARFGALTGRPYELYGLGGERAYRLVRSGDVPSTGNLCMPADEIDPSGWNLSGNAGAVTPLAWAVDRDPRTKWRTDRQLPGWKLQLDLGREETIGAVRLGLGYPYDGFPRDLTLKVRRPGERFTRVVHRDDLATKWELVHALVDNPSEAAITLRFEPVRARRLRFWIREGKGFDYALPDWTLPELYVYRACVPPPR